MKSSAGIVAFAAEATRFRDWVRHGTESDADAVRAALLHITALYSAALELPQPWSDRLADEADAAGITSEERQSAHRSAQRLPFTAYASMFEPLIIPPEEPVIGTIDDDIGDIYCDVVGGLQEYEAGRIEQAIWEWSYLLRMHWGQHATNAIVALHAWLAENAPDELNTKA